MIKFHGVSLSLFLTSPPLRPSAPQPAPPLLPPTLRFLPLPLFSGDGLTPRRRFRASMLWSLQAEGRAQMAGGGWGGCGCGLRRGRRGPGSVCVVRSRSVLRLPGMEKQETAGQEAWEAGAIAMIEIQPRSGGSMNCSPQKIWSPLLCFCGEAVNCCMSTACRRTVRDPRWVSWPRDVRCQSARLVAADAAASLVRSLRSLRTRVEDAAGTRRHFEVTGAGQKTSAACVTQRL